MSNYTALVNIGTRKPIKAGETFDGARLGNDLQKFIDTGACALVREVKKKEVK